jgi:hypothetical protein
MPKNAALWPPLSEHRHIAPGSGMTKLSGISFAQIAMTAFQ